MRVGMFTGRQVVHRDGRLLADVGLGRVVNELHTIFPDLMLAAVDPGEASERHSIELTLSPDAVLTLPAMPSFAHGWRQVASCRRVRRALEARSDVLLVQLAFQSPLALVHPLRPCVYHLVGDVLGMAQGSTRYEGIRRHIAVGYAHAVDRIQQHLIARPGSRLVSNGVPLLEHYGGRGTAVVSSSLTDAEIGSVPRTRPPGPPYRVVFVGYLRHEKGLDVLVDAFTRIRGQVEAELVIVGPGELAALGADVAAEVDDLVATGQARLVGALPFGPELFAHFAEADVVVLPSRTEGTPRVLVEARAFGAPVVATSVGGIPTSVTDGIDGLLVPPQDPVALADVVLRVLTDEPLRQQLVAGGYARARSTTVEAFTATLAAELRRVAVEAGIDPSV